MCHALESRFRGMKHTNGRLLYCGSAGCQHPDRGLRSSYRWCCCRERRMNGPIDDLLVREPAVLLHRSIFIIRYIRVQPYLQLAEELY